MTPFPDGPFKTILADPPWRFDNRGGKVSPEHKRLHRYATLPTPEIARMPVHALADPAGAHLYLWVPMALLRDGMEVMTLWGFSYKTALVWVKTTSDQRVTAAGVGFYFRTATELLLFGTRAPKGGAKKRSAFRTLPAARKLDNVLLAPRTRHSQKPLTAYERIEAASPGPRLELFARRPRDGWTGWGDQLPGDPE